MDTREPEDGGTERSSETDTFDDHPPVFAGMLVHDRYRIEGSLLGRGGFGTVHRARDETLGREVALKLITPRRASEATDPGFGRFLAEAQIVAGLDHPHIVPVYDAGVHEGRPWIVMKLIEGESLASLLGQKGGLDPRRAISILVTIARALGHAHRRRIVHRDVKPSNILVGRREGGGDHPWLLDFGVARAISGDSTWDERVLAGTPSYMAPEQLLGKRVDGRADLFSLGCVGIETLGGGRAFPGLDISEVVARIIHGEPSGLDEVRERAGAPVAAVISRALSKSSHDRFDDADAMADALEGAGLGGAAATRWRAPWPRRFGRGERVPAKWDGRTTLAISGLAKSYRRKTPVLSDLSLELFRGTTCALLGRNGSGKTTLIRILLGAARADSGEVLLFGREPRRARTEILSRIGHVPSQLPAYEFLRVGDFLRFVSRFREGWDESYSRHLVARFELPLEARIRTLSHGMRTKVSLLAALSHRPEFLVLDDPTVGLDAIVLGEFFDMLGEISRKEGTTILIASHNVDEVERFATHVAFLSAGRIVVSRTLHELLGDARRVRARFRDDVPELAQHLGLASTEITGRHIQGIATTGGDRVADRLTELGAEAVESSSVTLRELFVAMMR